MAVASDERFRVQEAREMLSDLLDALDDVPDVVARMLSAEARFDVTDWRRRLQTFLKSEGDTGGDQSDLFD
jgi:hypothetical protein